MAKHYRELMVWQLADELRKEVHQLTGSGPAARDFRFRDQLRDAVSGLPANVAEGFRRGRRSPVDFARFTTYSFSGLGEVEDRLDDGQARGYWDDAQLAPARRLIRRLTPALRNFLGYLLSARAAARTQSRHAEPEEPEEPHEPDKPQPQ
jgi:four helix bundle protein